MLFRAKKPRWTIHLLFYLLPLAKAYTVFETNCSAPVTRANYVSSPNTRGTLDILWSSLFTILACTWTLQHPNVPEQRGTRDPGRLGDIKWALKGLYRSTLRFIVTIIAPELIICAACLELLEAHQDYRSMQDMAKEDDVAWSLSHSYYANMGGFVIQSVQGKDDGHYGLYHLNSKGIHELRSRGYIDKMPDVATGEIKDKSKGDIFVKVIALGQILWSVFQIIARLVRDLPISPLEVAVVAFAVCAVVIYGLYWGKPQRVGVTITILTYDGVIPSDVLAGLKEVRPAWRLPTLGDALPGAPISVQCTRSVGYRGFVLTNVVTTLGAAVFGGIHVIAWNFAFPSAIELLLWRCASIATFAAPLCVCLIYLAIFHLMLMGRLEEDSMLAIGLLLSFTLLYVAARLFILVEMFRTLCFLPPGSYISTWTSNIPHVA
ncbi:hypothetical protein M419DRAFT_80984 [Trichoderma reesei RUT C-30]|uniref:Transmembrane protein n=1 Tax=Hypocrea jecorina (strain ATCC 56765 / BCRC 32924 / NRRL 11460 / Rut C-30) TaxID=1344414 RepID=A0A024SAR8_HYPJR|nr:hypothetical protein M419DRAFT_80984 [Trichoderma reesei RUT C-30]